MLIRILCVIGTVAALLQVGCSGPPTVVDAPPLSAEPSADQARAFVEEADAHFRELWTEASLRDWDYYTDVTDAHAAASAEAGEAVMAYTLVAVAGAARFNGVEVDRDTRRRLELIKRGETLVAPEDLAKRKELAGIVTELSGAYGKGKYCDEAGACQDLEALSRVMATSRDYDELLEAWRRWRTISPPMRASYQRFVELSNEGARGIGYADTGALWRSRYDMDPDAFAAEVDRLWEQVKPLYDALHCFVRARLAKVYGADKVPLDGPIPAHLLGNMWSQSWENIYPLVEPYPGQPSLDVTEALVARKVDPIGMVKMGEAFFVSLGFDPLPATFWERSLFEKPSDREVICHASAWDVTSNNDLRLKMCVQINMEDLITIHHELGHDYYYHSYYKLPIIFQAGANAGFHEGIGDTIALSITPTYLKQIGLMSETNTSRELVINKQMQDALAKISFLPFGRLIDQWRWDVFSGKTPPERYNADWWALRLKYQGVAAPMARSEADFDPGAKYHIPANTPYMRYFIAEILQFQFHKALCEAAGQTGPLHECSIYGSHAAGDRLKAMLALGASRPWPDALELMTGSREMNAGAIIEYFQPLMDYLAEQNAGQTCGW